MTSSCAPVPTSASLPAEAVPSRPLVVILHSRQPLTTDPAVTFDPARWESVVLTDDAAAGSGPSGPPIRAVTREDVPDGSNAPVIVHQAPRGEWAAAIRARAGERPVEIVTNDEYCLIDCAELRAEFGLPARHPARPAHYIDKVLMKERLAAAGVRVPRFLAFAQPPAGKLVTDLVTDPADTPAGGVPDPETGLALVVERVGLPAVAKPRREANSRGVSILATEADLRTWLTAHQGERDWQIEEFIEGTFHHVNAVVRAGVLTPVQVGTYLGPLLDLPSGRRLGGWTLPYDGGLARRAHELNRDVVAALGGEGAFVVHTEFAITRADELVVVEVAARAPGALVPELSRLHAGLNLEEVHLALQAGVEVKEPYPTGTQAAWVWVPVMPGERYRRTPEMASEQLVHVRRAARRTHNGEAGVLGVSVLLWHAVPEVLASDVRIAATAAWCGT